MENLVANSRLRAGRIEENVEGMDAVFLEMSDIHAGHTSRAIGWAAAPLQASGIVVTDSWASRLEDEVQRQVGEQSSHRFPDRGMALG
jgi:hypothetical protein